MKEILVRCRQGTLEKNLKSDIINTILILLIGIVLGVLSKLLDNMSLNDAIGWQRVLGILDLRNVFSRLSVWALFAVIIAVLSKGPLRASINVFGFFFTQAFSFGMYYIDISYYDGVVCLLLAIILLYKDKKQFILSLIGGALIVAPLIALKK